MSLLVLYASAWRWTRQTLVTDSWSFLLQAEASRRENKAQNENNKFKILRASHWRDQKFDTCFQVLRFLCSSVLHVWHKQRNGFSSSSSCSGFLKAGAAFRASFMRSKQPGWERKLLANSSTSPLGKDSVHKHEGGFKEQLSFVLIVSPHISKCSGRETCRGVYWV